MRGFKAILLTGTAVLALTACSSGKGPGDIGSRDDIVIRNAGMKDALPPPDHAPVKQVEIDSPAIDAGEGPSSAAVIGEGEPPLAKVIEPESMEPAPAASVAAAEPVSDMKKEGVPPQVAHQAVTWNQTERAAVQAPSTPPAGDLQKVAMAEATPAAPAATPAPSAPATQPQPMASAPQAAPASVYESPASRRAPAPLPPAGSAAVYAQPVQSMAASDAAPVMAPQADAAMPFDPATLNSKDPASVTALQKMLSDAGYYNGPQNGVMTSDTLNAYVKYQTAGNVPVAQAVAAPAAPAPQSQPAAPEPQASAAAVAAPAPQVFDATASLSDPTVIRAAQTALAAKGFYTGPATGALDSQTLNALSRYQGANVLPPGGLNLETLKHLGVVAQ